MFYASVAAATGTLKLKQAPATAKKRKNTTVHEQFMMCPGVGQTEGKIVCTCNHCHEIVQVAKVVNVSKLTVHLSVMCKSIPENIKELVNESTQRAKKLKKLRRIIPASGKSIGEETLQDTRAAVVAATAAPTHIKSSSALQAPTSTSSPTSTFRVKHQTGLTQFGQLMTKELAEKMLRFDIESILVRFEPLSRLEDPFVIAGILNKSPGLSPFLVTSAYALDVITPEIDRSVLDEINQICASTIGDANYSVDGVTVNARSHLLVTRSISCLTQFVDMIQLGDEVHVSSSESTAVCRMIEIDMQKLQRKVASVRLAATLDVSTVAVDNAAASMAKNVRFRASHLRNHI